MFCIQSKGEIYYATFEPGLIDDILKERYQNAVPFQHIVIDDFLPVTFLDKICENFPSKTEATVVRESKFQNLKRGYRPQNIPSNPCAHYLTVLNSAPVLEYLEELTGIKGLIPDPYFLGGGLHETDSGGALALHADFRLHPHLNLLRRINMIIYLNKSWSNSYGGELELWNPSLTDRVHSIEPIYNRCVIFNTSENSFHGHPIPLNLPENVSRRSIALYYYTETKTSWKYNSKTIWRKPNDSLIRKIFRKILRRNK